MPVYELKDFVSFSDAAEKLQSGDCLQIGRFSDIASGIKELLNAVEALRAKGADLISINEKIDTRDPGSEFFRICAELAAFDGESLRKKRREGIDRAREDGKYKGRRPIEINEDLFDRVVSLWQSGQINARQAMSQLDLKPNTFYRRIKEREEQKMKDYKKVEREIKAEIKEAAKQGKKDLDELKQQVHAEAEEVKKAAGEQLELHSVERELRKDRIRAEIEHHDTVKQMKKEVEAEAKELKKLIEE